ncbi:MAG: nicotinamide riboside transporter PnuC [Bacteroidales bacterium]|nr:nicotinamide riboside transporter PnuC [Bacteroidales bacterium]
MIERISPSFLEIFASLTGFVAIYFQIKAKPIYWPISIINVILYAIVFYQTRLYAETSLQIYYLLISIYGWIYWKKTNSSANFAISLCSKKLIIQLSIIGFMGWMFLAYILKKYTNTDVPYLDSFITSLSYIATYLLARKKIENWLLWIFIDFISIGLYYYKGLYFTIILFFALTILAIIGYKEWRKQLNVAT